MTLMGFIRESNGIEGLHHEPTQAEVKAYTALLALPRVTVADLEEFVAAIQPDAELRRQEGQNVRVGSHIPSPGGPHIEKTLDVILIEANSVREKLQPPKLYKRLPVLSAYSIHCKYESLHPFTDGNGRSGRVLWLWMMGGIENAPVGFLHHWYYQTLEASRL